MGDHYKIFALVSFSAVFVLIDATDQSSYKCMSGHECLNAGSTYQQGGVTYCCKDGHPITLEINSAPDIVSWFKFDQVTLKDFFKLLLAPNNMNNKASNDGAPRTDIIPDGVSRDETSDVDHRNLETSDITEVGADVQKEGLDGEKTNGKLDNFMTDEHYPTSNYDVNGETQRYSTRRNNNVKGGDQIKENRRENLVDYSLPASYTETMWEVLFPGSKLSHKLIRRDATGGERDREDVRGNSQGVERANPSKPNPVTLNSFGETDVTSDSRKTRCWCKSRSNSEATGMLGVIVGFLKKMWRL